MKFHHHHRPTGQEGEHCAPAKPPECVGDKAPGDGTLGLATELGAKERRLNEIEVPEHPDPADTRKKVRVPQKELPPRHRTDDFHRVSSKLGRAREFGPRSQPQSACSIPMEIALGIILNAYSATYAILSMRDKDHTPGFELRFEIHEAGGIGSRPGVRGAAVK